MMSSLVGCVKAARGHMWLTSAGFGVFCFCFLQCLSSRWAYHCLEREGGLEGDLLHASVPSKGLACILFTCPLVYLDLRLSEMWGNRKTWQREPVSTHCWMSMWKTEERRESEAGEACCLVSSPRTIAWAAVLEVKCTDFPHTAELPGIWSKVLLCAECDRPIPPKARFKKQ